MLKINEGFLFVINVIINLKYRFVCDTFVWQKRGKVVRD